MPTQTSSSTVLRSGSAAVLGRQPLAAAIPAPFSGQVPSTSSTVEKDGTSRELQSLVAELYETYRDNIYRFLVGLGLRPDVAQEATQDTFVEFHLALLRGDRIESPRSWLYKVASRTAQDYWRKYGREQAYIPLDTAEHHIHSAIQTPEESAAARQRARRISVLLTKLPADQLLCVQLRTRGLRYREIAEAVGASVSTVACRLAAALVFLRQDVPGRQE